MGLVHYICAGVVFSAYVAISSASDIWAPQQQEKIYRGGEATTILTPGDNEYNYAWYAVADRSSFVFQVKACSSVSIALSAFMEVATDYTVVVALGTDDNSRSSFTYPYEVGELSGVPTPGLLHCDEYRTLWVRWRAGVVDVGRGPVVGLQAFLASESALVRHRVGGVGLASALGSAAIWRIAENSGDQLVLYTSPNHGYNAAWKSVVDRHFFAFGVRACASVHVVLTERLGRPGGRVVEYVVGGWRNSRSLIRTSVLGGGATVRVSRQTPAVLDCDQANRFWISWLNGTMALGEGVMHGGNELLRWVDPTPIEVRYLSISTGFGQTGRWTIEDDMGSVNYIHTPAQDPESEPKDRYNTTWIESPKKEFFTFSVAACSYASVLLTDTREAESKFSLELVLGAGDNSKTGFRYMFEWRGWLKQVPSPSILDCKHPRHFWISWHGRKVTVGKGFVYGDSEFLRVNMSIDFEIRAIGFATVGNEGLWQIRENVGQRLFVTTPKEETAVFNHFWKTRRQDQHFAFAVRACGDARVLLSPTPGIDDDEMMYEVIVSGWQNTRSILQRKRGTGGAAERLVETTHAKGLLHCNAFVSLWVRWHDDRIQMGRGSTVGMQTVLDYRAAEGVLPIRAVSLSSGREAQWRVAEDTGDSISLFTGKVSYWLATRGPVATSLTFRVRACRGAQLILSSELAHNLSVAHYTIALDTRTVIRHNRRVRAHLYTPGVLSCAEDRYFWLSWKNGLVRLGSGSLHGVGEVLKWKNPNPFDVNAIGLVTNAGVKGRWRVQTNVASFVQFESPQDEKLQFLYVWKTLLHRESVVFSVRACANVNVVLTEQFHLHYVIIIGGWHNAKSVIREDGAEVTAAETAAILSCSEMRSFWIRWHSGYVVVGRGDVIGERIIMDYHPLVRRDVRNVAFATQNNVGLWRVQLEEDKYPGIVPLPSVDPVPVSTHSPASRPPVTNSTSRGRLSGGAVAGIVMGVAFVALASAVVVALVVRRGGVCSAPVVFPHRRMDDDVTAIQPPDRDQQPSKADST